MTNAKVKVTKEVAEAIEVLRAERNSDEKILRVLASSMNSWVGPKSSILNATPFDLVAKALYIGYEVEKSPEETIKDEWERLSDLWRTAYQRNDYEDTRVVNSKQSGIKFALEAYGLKIEGVNA